MTLLNKLNTKQINFVDKIYVLLIESFLYKSESDAENTAKVLLAALVSANIITIILLLDIIIKFDFIIEGIHVAILTVTIYIFIILYYSKNGKKIVIKEFQLKRSEGSRKRSYYLAIVLYLISFLMIAVLAVIKNKFFK